MKILYVSHQFLPENVAGTEILTYNSAREFLRRGHRVSVFTGYKTTFWDRENIFDSYLYNKIPVYRYSFKWTPSTSSNNLMKEEYYNPAVEDYFKQVVSRVKPDLVHIYHLQRLSITIIDICKQLGLPVVLTATDYWAICPTCQLLSSNGKLCNGPDKNMNNCLRHMATFIKGGKALRYMPDWLLSLFIRTIKFRSRINNRYEAMVRALLERPDFVRERIQMVDKLLVASSFMTQLLCQFGVEERKIEKIPFGVQQTTPVTPGAKVTGKILRFGFIGTLLYSKGAHVLCKAIRLLPKNMPLAVNIYGSPNLFPDYVKRLKAITGNDSRVRFHGMFPPDRLQDILSDIDVLIVPSLWYENTPLVIHSAQAALIPVVGSNVAGIKEVITDGKNGYLFERGNTKQLSQIMAKLVLDRKTLSRLARGCHRPLSIPEYVDRLETVYLNLEPLVDQHRFFDN